MSWLSALAHTYDVCIEYDEYSAGFDPLVPICHTTNRAAIEITVDLNGNFLCAEIVPKKDQNTIMPCSEDSAGRTSGMAAYPLGEKLSYLAPDIEKRAYKGDEKQNEKERKVRCGYDLYVKQISAWADSDNGPVKVKAVRDYVVKGTILKDLIDAGVLVSDDSGTLLGKSEIGDSALASQAKLSGEQDDIFVRWRVDIPGDPVKDTWQDKNLRESWIKYYTSQENRRGLCYATGEFGPLAVNHPAKIRHGGDKAKLISSDNKNDFTYKGRFETPEQACGVGYITSQKAHCALRWLASRQGYHEGGLCIITWMESGEDVQNPFDTEYTIFDIGDEKPPILGAIVSEKINNRFRGYESKPITDEVHVIAVDSATKGRMSVLLYRDYMGEEYSERLDRWYSSLRWHHYFGVKKDEEGKQVRFDFIGAPCPRDIAKGAYGEKAGDDTIRSTVERLIPCILEGRRIPRDIVDSAVRRASNPMAFEKPNDFYHRKAISIACSLYKNWSGGNYDMTLEEERTNRDYLYGRLLAVADVLEHDALRKSGEMRPTTALRLMQRFSDYPLSTWKTIELSLAPYKVRLDPAIAAYYEKKIQSIMALFRADDFINNSKLSGEFLLGYHCQKDNLYTKKDKNKEEE